MPNVRRGILNSKKRAATATATVDFAEIIEAAEDAKNVVELRLAVKGLATIVKGLAMAAGFWREVGV